MILEGKQEAREEGVKALVEVAQELGASKDVIIKQLQAKFQLSEETAIDAVNKYYQ